MGQILHKRARTTQEIRYESQISKESISSLARKFNISRVTIYIWKSREFIEDDKMGKVYIGKTKKDVDFLKNSLLFVPVIF